jgi:hypothetical protein
MPLQKLQSLDFSEFGGLGWLGKLQKASQKGYPHHGSLYDITIFYMGFILFGLLSLIRYIFKFGFLLPFMLFYFLLGLFLFHKHPTAPLLLIMNGLSLSFICLLFFLTMASDMRYVYITVCMTHASHALAIKCLRDLFKSKDTIKRIFLDRWRSKKLKAEGVVQ